MAVASLIQHTFNGGEFSPLMLGRQDLDQYEKSLYTCFNAVVLTQGAWTRRPGSLFLWNTKYSGAKKTRLVPFRYSITQAYLLEIGDGYTRFYLNHGLLTGSALAITGITRASTAVLTYTGTNPSNGDRMLINGIVGMTQLNNVEVIVASVNTGAKTFQCEDVFGTAINSTAFDAYTSGGSAFPIVELTTPWAEADLPALRWAQSSNDLYITHPNHMPQIISRTSTLVFTVGAVVFTDGPYDDVNTTSTTLTASATTGSVTITASAITGINSGTGFQATDIGRFIRIGNTSTPGVSWGYAEITGVSSTTVVTATVFSTLFGTSATVNWRLGVWSATTGYPSCIAFYQNRLGLAGAALFPQRFDLSVSAQLTNFAPTATDSSATVTDSNAISFNLFSNDINTIHWMQNHYQGLLIGTESGAWIVAPSTFNQALTPSNVSAQIANGYGSEPINTFLIDRAVLYVERGARKVRELSFVYMVNGFEAPDMTLLAPHVSDSQFVESVFQSEPTPTLWYTRTDGVLIGFTYLRGNNVPGWHRHELGGQSDNIGTIPIVENICSIPTSDGQTDELYMVVQRWVNGKSVRNIELLTKVWEDGDDQTTALYGDFGTLVSFNSPGTLITGLNWLEGETVGVLVDGKAHPTQVVTNGNITLEVAGSLVSIGKTYLSIGESLPAEGGAQDGSAQGKLKRIRRVGFWLMDTLGIEYGPNDGVTPNTPIIERQWGDNFGAMVPLFTGVFRDRFEGDWGRIGQVYWANAADSMFPATVLALMTQFEVSDES